MNCPKCDSSHVSKKGTVESVTGSVKQRYKCVSCHHNFYDVVPAVIAAISKGVAVEDAIEISTKGDYVRDEAWWQPRLSASRFVITSAQSNTPVNQVFLRSLEAYCDYHDAELLIIPHRYRNPTTPDEEVIEDYPHEISQYLFENNIKLHPMLKVLGQLKIASTADNPLSGLAPVSKGDSIIVGHNQLQLTTLPVQVDDYPVIMTTTGTISAKNYSISKQGYKAEFNHSQSAVVVELDGKDFHLRHLNFDGEGFYDFTHYYTPKKIIEVSDSVEAIVTGDEHAVFIDHQVLNATYGEDGMVQTLKPRVIVRHDVLDCYSISHHHRNNFITRFKKFTSGQHKIEEELDETVNFILDTTPSFAMNVLVPSNHTDHLTKWLNEGEAKQEPWNARLYHYLMYKVLSTIEENPIAIPDPFELYSKGQFEANECKVTFLKRTDTYKIHGIEIASHGDKGANGARGSREQFSKLPSKTIIGHSHSPGIEKGCYQTGTSSSLTLEYNDGPSSWLNTHCLIYRNGKRQLVNIINGKWRSNS